MGIKKEKLLTCSQMLIYLLLLLAFHAAYGIELGAYDADSLSSFRATNSGVPPSPFPPPLMVNLTLIEGAASKGAVCLDGTLPAYHLHRGHGAGASNWLIHLEGGAWCNSIRTCTLRTITPLGSSKYMDKQLPFIGMLSNRPEENPVFYNWNRVKIRYCYGASFMRDSQNKESELYFRGQRIWSAALEELMSKGMQNASQALLSGCSAGGLAAILHCDQFRKLFPSSIKVKCLSDAGFFLDAVDVSGRRILRKFFQRMIRLQKLQGHLPRTCTSRLDPTSCFFPQNLVADVKTPLFILNAAYDTWQIQGIDPQGSWVDCKLNHSLCAASQIQIIQDLRNQMLSALQNFSMSDQNGLFINSCFAHCQCERGDTWFTDISVRIRNMRIAESVRDWYFDRASVKAIDCSHFCDKTCPILVPL